jgi:hypothetical protein
MVDRAWHIHAGSRGAAVFVEPRDLRVSKSLSRDLDYVKVAFHVVGAFPGRRGAADPLPAVTRTAVARSGAGPNTTVVSGRSSPPPWLIASKLGSPHTAAVPLRRLSGRSKVRH